MGREDMRKAGLHYMHKLCNIFANRFVEVYWGAIMHEADNCAFGTDEEKVKILKSFGKYLALSYCAGYQAAKEGTTPTKLYLPAEKGRIQQ